jgi:hypothetical protein
VRTIRSRALASRRRFTSSGDRIAFALRVLALRVLAMSRSRSACARCVFVCGHLVASAQDIAIGVHREAR